MASEMTLEEEITQLSESLTSDIKQDTNALIRFYQRRREQYSSRAIQEICDPMEDELVPQIRTLMQSSAENGNEICRFAAD